MPDHRPFNIMSFSIGVAISIIFFSFAVEWDASYISAFSTVVIATLTVFLAYDSNKTRTTMLEQAIRPNIVIYQLKHPNENHYSDFYDIHLKNIGVGTALYIKVRASELVETGHYTTDMLDATRYNVNQAKESVHDSIEKCTLFQGEILSIGPNQEVVRIFEPSDSAWFYTMKVTISFEDTQGKEYSTTDSLDLDPERPNH